MKLLDDFNLDSIKAGSLLNGMFKDFQLQGKLNASNFLNASLDNIISEVDKIVIPQGHSSATSSSTDVNVKQLLHTKIESITGFPSDSFAGAMKLLDDFNLDSIKAGSLLNGIF